MNAMLAVVISSVVIGGEDRANTVQPGQRLYIQAGNVLPDSPIHGVFRVESSGKLQLGLGYGRVDVKGMTIEDAEDAIRNHLKGVVKDPKVSVTWYDPLPGLDPAALEKRLEQLERELRMLRARVDALEKK